jgi:hypothetical protein
MTWNFIELHRRSLLTGAGVVLSRCLGRESSPGDSDTNETTGGTEEIETVECEQTTMEREIEGEVLREVSVTRNGQSPVAGTSFSVDLVRDAMTTEHPATVEITFRNESESEREFGFGRPAPLTARKSDESPGWTLLPEDQTVGDEPIQETEDCWKPDFDDDAAYESLDVLDYYDLGSCETVSETYELWVHYERDECMPTGEYRFSDEFVTRDGDGNENHRWAFSLEITEP